MNESHLTQCKTNYLDPYGEGFYSRTSNLIKMNPYLCFESKPDNEALFKGARWNAGYEHADYYLRELKK